MRIGPFTIFERKSIEHVELEDLIASGPTAAGVTVTTETALRVPAVAAAIRTISEAAACLDVHVVKIADDGTETRVPGHLVKVLLSGQANDWTSSFELIRSLVVDALTYDRGGLARVGKNFEGKPVEIIRFRPGYIQVNFPDDSLRRIEQAVADGERRHSAEIRIAIEASLSWHRLIKGLAPRERALQVFADLGVWDTEANNGVLLYLLMADHAIEVVADRAAAATLGAAELQRICNDLSQALRAGDHEGALLAAVATLHDDLAEAFPLLSPEGDRNELPDPPTIL